MVRRVRATASPYTTTTDQVLAWVGLCNQLQDGWPLNAHRVAAAINWAYAQGWADAELGFINSLNVLHLMDDDVGCNDELWDIAQKRPRSEEGLLYRRDWFEHGYAYEQLQHAGIDPWGKRPAAPAESGQVTVKRKSEKKKRVATTKR